MNDENRTVEASLTGSARFTVICDAGRKEYSVSETGEADRTGFESVDAALAYIATLIGAVMAVNISNELGKVFMQTDVTPVERG